MKRYLFLITSCLLLTIQAIAQSETDKKVITKEKEQTKVEYKSLNNYAQPIEVTPHLALPEHKEVNLPLDSTRNSLTTKQSIHYYENSAIIPFYKNTFFYLESDQKRYITLANYNFAYMALGYKLSDKLKITGGLLAIKQFSAYQLHSTARSGVKLSLNYSISDKLNFNLWSQYITNSKINSPTDILMPQTESGASMRLNIGGSSHITIGTKYQYDENKEKGSYQYGSKLKVNF